MDFPAVDRVVYDQNPLAEVVCQLRFPRLLELDQSVPAHFQKLMSSDFPLIDSRETATFEVAEGGFGTSPATRRVIYEFAANDRSTSISLCSDFIAVKTTNYARWEDFSGVLSSALEALRASYQIPFYTRIGIRYVNVIDRRQLGIEKLQWVSLVRPSSLGLLGDKDMPHSSIIEQSSTTALLIPSGNVTIRTGIGFDENDNVKKYVIDCDFFTEDQLGSDEDAFGRLTKYNEAARNAFRWFVKPELHDAMGPRPA